MTFVLTFIILLFFIFVGAYFLLDDFDPEGMLLPALLTSGVGGGAVAFALSDTDRVVLIGSVLFLIVGIILVVFLFKRRARRRKAKPGRLSKGNSGTQKHGETL